MSSKWPQKRKKNRDRTASLVAYASFNRLESAKMDCKSARKLIAAFLDGELASPGARDLGEHLASCGSCRDEEAAIRRATEALGVLPGIEPAFTMTDIRERAARRRPSPFFALLPPVSRLVAASMAIAAIACGSVSGVYYGAQSTAQVAAQSQPAEAETADSLAGSLGLDAFDNGLAGALHLADADIEPEGQVTQ